MINSIISALLQVAVVLLIAAVVWVAARRPEPFHRFVGLYSAPWLVVGLALTVGSVVAILMTFIPGIHDIAAGEGTVVGEAAAGGLSAEIVTVLAVRAVIQTSVSEELLFRGLIGHNLIRRWGFLAGNTVQAVMFGLVHLLLLLTPNATGNGVLLLVIFTTVVGFILGWTNYRFADGSILPGWAAHGAGNLTAYLLLASAI